MQVIVKNYGYSSNRALWELWDDRGPRQTPNERGYFIRYFPNEDSDLYSPSRCVWIVPGTLQ